VFISYLFYPSVLFKYWLPDMLLIDKPSRIVSKVRGIDIE